MCSVFVRLIGKGLRSYTAMSKSNFPVLVLFELRIYHVEREFNVGTGRTDRYLVVREFFVVVVRLFIYQERVRDGDVCERFVFYLPPRSNVSKTYYSRSKRRKIRIRTTEDVRDRKLNETR